MNTRHIAEAQKLVARFSMPDSVKQSMQADLHDAICKGFLIDFEQLSANLTRLADNGGRCC